MKMRAKSIPTGIQEVGWSGVEFLMGIVLFFLVAVLHQRALQAAVLEAAVPTQVVPGASK